jgi:poly(3-hydroxybutyrate) depolymerase
VVNQTISAYDSGGANKKLVARTYYLDRPHNLTNSPTNKAPLLVTFGYPDAHWHALAPTDRFVIATIPANHTCNPGGEQFADPEIAPSPGTLGACVRNCGSNATTLCSDNPAVKAVLDQVIASQNIDPRKVYATGGSRGGTMTMALVCDTNTSSYFSAVVVASATLFATTTNGATGQATGTPNCPAMLGTSNGYGGGTRLSPNTHVSMAWFYGDQDGLACAGMPVTACLDTGAASSSGRWNYSGPQDAGATTPPPGQGATGRPGGGSSVMFGARMGCSGAASTITGSNTTVYTHTYTGCSDSRRATETVMVHTGGHTFDGLLNVNGFNPYAAAWDFFTKYGG